MAIPNNMKAAILVEQGKPLVIADIDLPRELDVGQVLVKVHFSGICGSQLGEIDGVKGPDKFLPHLLGHEASGTVVGTGPGVKNVQVGNKVVLHWRKGAGIDAPPPKYRWQGHTVNAGLVTTFNEYCIVAESRVTAIPDDSDLQVAALFGCAVTTGFGVVVNNARIKIGDSVVVFGAGGVGLNIIQGAALAGAYPVIAVDLFDNRLALAREMGATHLVNSKSVEARKAILDIAGSDGVDVFIDNTGQPMIIELGYQLTKPQGRVTLVGVPKKGNNVNIYSLPLHFGKALSGSHGGETVPQEDIPKYHQLYRAGRIKLRELITNLYELGEINTAIAKMRDGSLAGRCLIRISDEKLQ